MTLQASPKKLPNGNWGAQIKTDDVAVGDTVTITTRAGKTWDAQVSEIVSHNDGITIVATQRAAAATTNVHSMHTHRSGRRQCQECGTYHGRYTTIAHGHVCDDCL